MPLRVSRRDNMRLMAARDATQLAAKKWERIAWGADALDDLELRDFAKLAWARLQSVFDELNERART